MKLFTSRPAIALASAAALSMSASPAMARGWHRYHRHHHGHVDGGDVVAGILIVGGIAAIAAAASNANKQKRERESRDRYPDRDYRDYDRRSGRYDDRSRDERYAGPGWRSESSMDTAVDRCVNEVERDNRRVDTVESVSRDPDGWRVDGRMEGGRDYSCIVDHDGDVRRATVDGRHLI